VSSVVEHTVIFNRPIEQVFAYATTMGHWPKWQPATERLTGGQIEEPAQKGDTATEQVRSAGLTGEVRWLVTECNPPHHFAMRTTHMGLPLMSKVCITLTYSLEPDNDATRFRRRFSFTTGTLLLRILERVYFRRRVEVDSVEALDRLKRLIEAQPS
jgi:uncharacterized protein YndB with AHSA1/START domain